MRKKTKYGLIIVALVVILGLGFGIYRDEILGRCYFNKGEKHFEAEEYEEATQYLKTSLRFNPDNPRTHLLLMKTYWGRGLWEEMREERDKIIALGEEAPPIPLVIKDLEDAHITATRSLKAEGWYFQFGSSDTYGWIYDNANLYVSDWNASEPLILCVVIETQDDTIAIQAGDTLEIIYDGRQILTAYLPAITENTDALHVASDGSTYYDENLTQLAQSVPLKPDKEAKNE